VSARIVPDRRDRDNQTGTPAGLTRRTVGGHIKRLGWRESPPPQRLRHTPSDAGCYDRGLAAEQQSLQPQVLSEQQQHVQSSQLHTPVAQQPQQAQASHPAEEAMESIPATGASIMAAQTRNEDMVKPFPMRNGSREAAETFGCSEHRELQGE
jgi:hypothetical protein